MTPMPPPPPKSPLDRFLGLFAEVRAGEGPTAVLLTLNVILLLAAYSLVKPVREALILAEGGAEVKSYAAAGQAILLLGAVPLYAALAGRLPRRRLINGVTLFFAACFVLFYLLARLHVPLGVAFFLYMGIFNLMVIAQFWSFANDLYTPEEGKRLFPIVAVGASSGAVIGSFAAGRLIGPFGVYQLLLVAAGALALSLLLTNVVDARERNRAAERAPARAAEAEKPVGKGDAFRLVLGNRYLLWIALLMLFLNWVNTNGGYILDRTVERAAAEAVASGTTNGLSEKDYIGKFYAGFQFAVNLAGLVVQFFLVSRILKYLGVRVAILFLPVIALGGYAILAFYPVLSAVRWAKTAENATDYSLQNTVRQVLFLPTTREQKYKAKQAIDTFFVRAGDVLSAALVFAGTTYLSFGTRQFALVNLGFVLIWITLAVLIGLENRRLTSKVEGRRSKVE
jgi:AAA family ATP:ADP antiporter